MRVARFVIRGKQPAGERRVACCQRGFDVAAAAGRAQFHLHAKGLQLRRPRLGGGVFFFIEKQMQNAALLGFILNAGLGPQGAQFLEADLREAGDGFGVLACAMGQAFAQECECP